MSYGDYVELNINPNDRSHGYECGKCGYTPTQRELDNGTCNGCREARKISESIQ